MDVRRPILVPLRQKHVPRRIVEDALARRVAMRTASGKPAPGLAVVLVGQRFSWAMHLGSRGQVLIDLIGAGALVGLGLFQLTPAVTIGEEGWAMQLMGQLPELEWVPLLRSHYLGLIRRP